MDLSFFSATEKKVKLQEDIATIIAESEILTHSHTGAVLIPEETRISGLHHHGTVTPHLRTSSRQHRVRAFSMRNQRRLTRLVTVSIVSRASLSDRPTFKSICWITRHVHIKVKSIFVVKERKHFNLPLSVVVFYFYLFCFPILFILSFWVFFFSFQSIPTITIPTFLPTCGLKVGSCIQTGLWATGQGRHKELVCRCPQGTNRHASGCEKLQDPALGVGKGSLWGHPGAVRAEFIGPRPPWGWGRPHRGQGWHVLSLGHYRHHWMSQKRWEQSGTPLD